MFDIGQFAIDATGTSFVRIADAKDAATKGPAR